MTHPPMPPLNALRAFDAAARHLSFSKAAAELNVTPAALSHRIKGLEAFLGIKLFRRRTRRIELTDAGRLIQPDIRDGFTSLERGVRRLHNPPRDNVIVVTAGPSITAKWLAPRLHRFAAAHPQIDLRISASVASTDFKGDGFDAAIRFGTGNYPGLYTEMLLEDVMLPLCSPALLEGTDPIRTPADLSRFTLIHDEALADLSPAVPDWHAWLEKAGFPDIDVGHGLHFNLSDHAIDAAAEGAGVALARKALAKHDIDSGRLVAPFDIEIGLKQAYYFVCPAGHEDRPTIKLFREWLAAEIATG